MSSASAKYILAQRPRRNRQTAAIRGLVQETESLVDPGHLVLPLFVLETEDLDALIPIKAMPGTYRMGINQIVRTCVDCISHGVNSVALFPVVLDAKKTPRGEECLNDNGILQRCVRAIKKECGDKMCVITDIALDPYSSDGHDGVVDQETGTIVNDDTVSILAQMAVAQAKAGADIVAPSDMMDGRIGIIRAALDAAGYERVGILSYCVKYASAFYGPFREALDSAPRFGDKKTYQMNPANGEREVLRELALDEQEGADIVMVKPGTPFLDVVRTVRDNTSLPVAIYHVSGEFAMLKAAAQNGWIDYDRAIMEVMVCMRRAGADLIFTYAALDVAKLVAKHRAAQQPAALKLATM